MVKESLTVNLSPEALEKLKKEADWACISLDEMIERMIANFIH